MAVQTWFFVLTIFYNIVYTEFSEDIVMKDYDHLLKEVLPTLTSRVTFGTESKGPFTCTMKPMERTTKLKELLWG